MYLQITRCEITQSSCKRDTKSKSHVGMKLAPVRVFSCKHPLTIEIQNPSSTGIRNPSRGIQNPSSTNKDWNPPPGIRNPPRGIHNQRLYWILLHRANLQLSTLHIQASIDTFTLAQIPINNLHFFFPVDCRSDEHSCKSYYWRNIYSTKKNSTAQEKLSTKREFRKPLIYISDLFSYLIT